MRIVLLLLSLNLVSCSQIIDDLIKKDGPAPRRNTSDPKFDKYLEILRSNGISTNTPVIFSSRNSGIAGTCTIWSDGYREIQIDPNYWSRIGESYKIELLAHEFGHCDYNLGHDNSYGNGPCGPDSIMYDTNFGGSCFYDSIRELINNDYLGIF